MSNDYRDQRRALCADVVAGIRDALKAIAAAEDGEGKLELLPPLLVDGVSVRVDPLDRTAWLVTVSIPRHTITDDEAQVLSLLADN